MTRRNKNIDYVMMQCYWDNCRSKKKKIVACDGRMEFLMIKTLKEKKKYYYTKHKQREVSQNSAMQRIESVRIT